MSNRRADSVLFGFDFQVNAAIILLLENIKDLHSVRLEGNYEDIEIILNNKQYILAQAKSVVRGSSDFSNVRQNLRKALLTLSEGCRGLNIKQLIYITNSYNPLNDQDSKPIFEGKTAFRRYSSLPSTTQQIIDGYLERIDDPLNTESFFIQTLPFETDEDAERYKFIKQEMYNFEGKLNVNMPGLGLTLLGVWHNDIFRNGTKSNSSIKLNKKELIWPIMVLATDVHRCNNDILDKLDPCDYNEIVNRYKYTIDIRCERIEFFTKILFDFNSFESKKTGNERFWDFIESSWKHYLPELSIENIAPEVQESLIRVILYNILYRRYTIDKIKKVVNL